MKMIKKEMIEQHPLGIILLGTLLGALAAFGGSFLIIRILQMAGFAENLQLRSNGYLSLFVNNEKIYIQFIFNNDSLFVSSSDESAFYT